MKIAYAPWADQQRWENRRWCLTDLFTRIFSFDREALWQYFLPTLYEECPVTPEPSIGQTRIFKTVRFKLWLNCPTVLDLYFMNKAVRIVVSTILPSETCSGRCLETASNSCGDSEIDVVLRCDLSFLDQSRWIWYSYHHEYHATNSSNEPLFHAVASSGSRRCKRNIEIHRIWQTLFRFYRCKFIFIILACGMPFKTGSSISTHKRLKCTLYSNTRTSCKVIERLILRVHW